MTDSNQSPNNRPVNQNRVRKARSEFPLFPHASHRWANKIRGKFQYFGGMRDDRDGQRALKLWQDQKDDLLAGRVPRDRARDLQIVDLINAFLTAKKRLLGSNEIVQQKFNDYDTVCKRVLSYFVNSRYIEDIIPADFEAFRSSFAKKHQRVAFVGRPEDCVRPNWVFWLRQPISFGIRFVEAMRCMGWRRGPEHRRAS